MCHEKDVLESTCAHALASLGGTRGATLFVDWPKRVVLCLWLVTQVKKTVFLLILIFFQF